MARRRGNSWQGSLKTHEKYFRYSFPTEAQAEEWEREAREAHKTGKDIPDPTVTERGRPTLRSFFDEYQGNIWPNTLPRNTQSNQRACERFLGADIPLHHITLKRLTIMVADMQKAGYAPGTANTRLSHLKVLLRYAKRLDMVDESLEFPWVKKGDNSRMRFLTEAEEKQLLDLLNHWGRDDIVRLVSVLIDTGCRPSELITAESNGVPIKWSEVSVSAGGTAPDINDPATGEVKAVISLMRTKTGKYRVLPLTDRAKNAFLVSKQVGEARPFGNLRADMVSELFREAAVHLKLNDGTKSNRDNVVLYTCRHTCASRLVQRGADLRRVMQWMGHTNINTTLRYAKLTPTDIFSLGDML